MSADDFLSATEQRVRDIAERYVDELDSKLSTRDLEAVLHGEKDDPTSRDLGSKPETHVQNNFVYPLLDAMGLAYTEGPYGSGGGGDDTRDIVWPDFELDDVTEYTIGENKAPNNLEESHRQVLDYLDRRSIGADYAIATDGLRWRVYRVEQGGDTTEFPIVRRVDLRDLLREISREKSSIAATTLNDVAIPEEIGEFTELFEDEAFEQFVTQTAPQELRDSRQQDVEEFYELYIEYLFGESSKYDEATCLVDDIRYLPSSRGRVLAERRPGEYSRRRCNHDRRVVFRRRTHAEDSLSHRELVDIIRLLGHLRVLLRPQHRPYHEIPHP